MKFEYSYFEKGCRKNVHTTVPKGNMGYDQYTVPDDCSWRTYFCYFPAQARIISKKRPLFTKVVLQILFRICQSNGKKEIHEFRDLDFFIEIHPEDGLLGGEILFLILRSIAKAKSRIPNQTQA